MAPVPSSKPVSGHITLSKTPQSKPRLHLPSTKSMHPSPIPISAKKKPHKWTTLSKSSVRFVITQIWKRSPRQAAAIPRWANGSGVDQYWVQLFQPWWGLGFGGRTWWVLQKDCVKSRIMMYVMGEKWSGGYYRSNKNENWREGLYCYRGTMRVFLVHRTSKVTFLVNFFFR